jgi:hypothetical protein
MKSFIAGPLLATALALGGCSGNDQNQRPQSSDSSTITGGQRDTAPPVGTMTPPVLDTASTAGTIVRIDPPTEADLNILGTLMLEDRNNADTSNNRTVVRVMSTTGISAEENGKRTPKRFADLKSGMVMRALFHGPVPMIYPMRVNADEILIISAGG